MSVIERIGRDGAAAHWRDGEHFAEQCSRPATRAVIERRWRLFARLIDEWSSRQSAGGTWQVLDAGCGDGINLVGLHDILRARGVSYALTGVDGNRSRLDRAQALGVADRLVHASLTALPAADASYDLVLCNHVLEHIPAPERAAAQIARVLRRGGLAMIGVPNEGCLIARARNHLLQRSILDTTDHVNFFTRPTLARMLTSAGFDVQAVHPAGLFLPHQRLHDAVMSSRSGRRVIAAAGRLLPSQAQELVAVATRGDGAGGVSPAMP